MRLSLAFVSILILALSLTVPAHAARRDCLSTELARLLDQHQGQVLDEVKFFEGKLTQGYMDLERNGLYDPDAIYIGVSNHTREGAHHYYLLSGGKRFDGGLMFNPAKVKTFYSTPYFANGVIFKITSDRHLIAQTARKIEELKDYKGLTCLHGACKVLDEVEINIPHQRNLLFPVSAKRFADSLMKGEVKINGRPAKVEMIATSEEELAHYLRTTDSIDYMSLQSLVRPAIKKGMVIIGLATAGRIVWIVTTQ